MQRTPEDCRLERVHIVSWNDNNMKIALFYLEEMRYYITRQLIKGSSYSLFMIASLSSAWCICQECVPTVTCENVSLCYCRYSNSGERGFNSVLILRHTLSYRVNIPALWKYSCGLSAEIGTWCSRFQEIFHNRFINILPFISARYQSLSETHLLLRVVFLVRRDAVASICG